MIRLPSAPANEKFLKSLINKLEIFKNYRVKFNIVWHTRKIKSLFNNKYKVNQFICVTYRRTCSCGADYAGELCVTLDYDEIKMKMVQIRIPNVLSI